MMVGKTCECNGWKVNIPKLDTAILMATLSGMDCNVETGNYCPYCGEELEVIE